MNISLPNLKIRLLSLLWLCLPFLVVAQQSEFYDHVEVLKDNSLTYDFQSIISVGTLDIPPSHGTASVSGPTGNRIFTLDYTPNAGYIGKDTLRIKYGVPPSQVQYRVLYIDVVEAFAHAKADFVSTTTGTPVDILPLLNDLVSDTISLFNVSWTDHGTTTINGDTITYTPEPGFTGTAALNYTVCVYNSMVCDMGTVTIFVEQGGTQNDTTYLATKRGTQKELILPLNNGFQVITAPSNGTVTEQLPGQITYQPNSNFYGAVDVFTYAYNTSSTTSLMTYVIEVMNTLPPQKFAFEDMAFVEKDGVVDIEVLTNDFGLNLNISSINIAPQNGTASINGDIITYVPNAGFTGVDQFRYLVCTDGGFTNCDKATVNITVDNLIPALPEYSLETPENTPKVLQYPAPIEGYDFYLPEPESLEGGEIDFYPGWYSGTVHGQSISGFNLIVYTPPTDYTGPDEFEIEYCVGTDCELVKIKAEVIPSPNTNIDTFCINDCVWAGDANYDGVVNASDLLPVGYHIGGVGYSRTGSNTDWYGQFASDWDENQVGNINLKHVDTDGDGAITAADTSAIHQSYARLHNLTVGPAPIASPLPLIYVPQNPGPYNPGDLVVVDIVLGVPTTPALDVHGLAFAVNYNTDIVEPGTFELQFHPKSWMSYNSPTIDLVKEPLVGKVEAAYTRTSGRVASGFGTIGTLSFIIDDDIVGIRPGEELSTRFTTSAPAYMNSAGVVQGLTAHDLEISVIIPRNRPQADNSDLIVYPNPVQERLQVHVNGNNFMREFMITDLAGRQVYHSGRIDNNHGEVDVSVLQNGLYIVTAITKEGVLSQKIDVMNR